MNISSSISKIISSYKTSILLMLLFALLIGIATFVEKYHGTEVAKLFFYYSPLLILIQFLLVVNLLCVCSRYELINKKKIAFVIIHFAFVIILIGAFVTHLFGVEGSIHLREGESTNKMLIDTNRGQHFQQLPFTIELQKFILTRYPGSSSPSSFQSIVEIDDDKGNREVNISMNNVLDIKGYRLFQSSYDTDEKGTILSVNQDQWGKNISYMGYFLLLIGFIWSFISSNSRLRYLINQLKELKATSIIALLLLFGSSLTAQNKQTMNFYEVVQSHKIPVEHAEKFGALPMQASNGRMKPINTFSSEIARKLHHSDRVGELNSDQFLLSLLTFSEMWKQVPFIHHANKDVAQRYQLTEKMCSYADLFDEQGYYKLERDVAQAHAKSPSARNKFDKDIIKLDEQINIFNQLIHHRLLRIIPKKDDANHKWYASGDDLSDFSATDSMYIAHLVPQYVNSLQASIKTGNWTTPDKILKAIKNDQTSYNTTLVLDNKKFEAELLFNKLNIFKHCQKGYLIIGGLMLVLLFIHNLKGRRWTDLSINLLTALAVLFLLFQLFGLALRGYIGGYAPWSNSYETMIYISLISIIGGLIFIRHSKISFALATLFSGVILFVAGLNWMDPQINTLVPVLKSPWLMIHVAVIVAAYSFFGISFLLSATNLILLSLKNKLPLERRIKELSIINEMSILIGLALMTIGTFLGAIWANESWGRYWGWDSKETWALITILVYAVVIHLRLTKKWDNPLLFNLVAMLAFLTVLMTYFGVNYYLTGLHSYA